MIDIDQLVFNTLIHCLQILVSLPAFAQQFRTPIIMTRLMQLPRNPSVPPEAKMTLVKIIRVLAATEQKHGGDYTMPIGGQAKSFVTKGMNYGKEMMQDYQQTRIKQLQEKAMVQNQQNNQFATLYKPPPAPKDPNLNKFQQQQYQNQQYDQYPDQQQLYQQQQQSQHYQQQQQQQQQYNQQYQNQYPQDQQKYSTMPSNNPQRLPQSRNLSRKNQEAQNQMRQSHQNDFINVQNNQSYDQNIQDKHRYQQNELDASRRSRRGIQSGYKKNQQIGTPDPYKKQTPQMLRNSNIPVNNDPLNLDQGQDYQTFDLQSMNLMQSEQESLVRDYVNMLDPPAYNEMFNFALASLIPALKQAKHIVMEEKELFMKCFNLIEFKCDQKVLKYQAELFKVMSQCMNEARASDAVRANGVQRMIQAHAGQYSEIQLVIGELFEAIIKNGKVSLDANSLIMLAVCKQLELAELGMKALSSISDPTSGEFNEMQFENHLPLILNSTTTHLSKSYRVNALTVISNLCLRDKLKAPLIYAGAIQVLVGNLRSGEVEIERLAAKGLANLCSSRKDIRHKIISELGMEIKRLHNNNLDGIVAAYLQAMIHP